MKLKQLSVFLENQPGALSRICRVLGDAKINIQTFSLAETTQFGIFRLIVQDWERAKEVLEQGGCVVKVTDVLAIEITDQPGSLADLLQVVERAGINVEYTYAFTCREKGKGLVAFRFDQPDRALAELIRAGVHVMGHQELLARLKISGLA